MKKLIIAILLSSLIIILVCVYVKEKITQPNYNKPEKTSTSISISEKQPSHEYEVEPQKFTPETSIKDKIDVVVPDYEVSHFGYSDYDYVSIPKGTYLIEENKVEIPTYAIRNAYPEDYKIQKVTLINKSEITKETDLNLPPVITKPGMIGTDKRDESSKISLIKSCYAEKNDWYPNNFFSWIARESPSGKEELEISIFPFHYNIETKDSIYYKKFSFKIDYIKSNIRILHLYESKSRYKPTEPINYDFTVFNFTDTQTYYLESSLFTQSENYTEKLEKQAIKINKGQNDFIILLKPNFGFEYTADEGNVVYTIKIINENNLLLDSETDSFYISKK